MIPLEYSYKYLCTEFCHITTHPITIIADSNIHDWFDRTSVMCVFVRERKFYTDTDDCTQSWNFRSNNRALFFLLQMYISFVYVYVWTKQNRIEQKINGMAIFLFKFAHDLDYDCCCWLYSLILSIFISNTVNGYVC